MRYGDKKWVRAMTAMAENAIIGPVCKMRCQVPVCTGPNLDKDVMVISTEGYQVVYPCNMCGTPMVSWYLN